VLECDMTLGTICQRFTSLDYGLNVLDVKGCCGFSYSNRRAIKRLVRPVRRGFRAPTISVNSECTGLNLRNGEGGKGGEVRAAQSSAAWMRAGQPGRLEYSRRAYGGYPPALRRFDGLIKTMIRIHESRILGTYLNELVTCIHSDMKLTHSSSRARNVASCTNPLSRFHSEFSVLTNHRNASRQAPDTDLELYRGAMCMNHRTTRIGPK
jgi:hypothetical protein